MSAADAILRGISLPVPDSAVGVLSLLATLTAVVLLVSGFSSLICLVTGRRRSSVLLILCCSISAAFLFGYLPRLLDSTLNRVEDPSLLPMLSAEGTKFHYQLFVADLHADSLLWPKRNLLQEGAGHMDLPRLRRGNVALQAFTIVTGSPGKLNFERNEAPSLLSDSITRKAALETWGFQAVRERAARVLFQINSLEALEAASDGQLVIIRNQEDYKNLIVLRREDPLIVGAIIGIEGLHALDGKLPNIDLFYNRGVRMMGLTHFFDNKLGGSAHGVEKGGLTPFGLSALRRMEQLGVLADVAHASPALIEDLLGNFSGTVVSSHTGLQSVCPGERNLSDDHLRRIAGTGGVLGIAMFRPALCGDNLLESLLDTIIRALEVAGENAVSLGSDFDGTVTTPFAVDGLVYITDGLLKRGVKKEVVEKVMGTNVARMLQRVLQ